MMGKMIRAGALKLSDCTILEKKKPSSLLIFLSDSTLGAMICRDPGPSTSEVRFPLVDFPRGPSRKGLPWLVFLYGIRLVVITQLFYPIKPLDTH